MFIIVDVVLMVAEVVVGVVVPVVVCLMVVRTLSLSTRFSVSAPLLVDVLPHYLLCCLHECVFRLAH